MGIEGWVGHVGMAVCSESKELTVVGGPLARPTQPSSLRRLVHLCDDCFPGDLLLVLVSDFTFAFFCGSCSLGVRCLDYRHCHCCLYHSRGHGGGGDRWLGGLHGRSLSCRSRTCLGVSRRPCHNTIMSAATVLLYLDPNRLS